MTMQCRCMYGILATNAPCTCAPPRSHRTTHGNTTDARARAHRPLCRLHRCKQPMQQGSGYYRSEHPDSNSYNNSDYTCAPPAGSIAASSPCSRAPALTRPLPLPTWPRRAASWCPPRCPAAPTCSAPWPTCNPSTAAPQRSPSWRQVGASPLGGMHACSLVGQCTRPSPTTAPAGCGAPHPAPSRSSSCRHRHHHTVSCRCPDCPAVQPLPLMLPR